MNKLPSYRELLVWQKAILLCTEIYKLTHSFPREEIFGLTSQIRRSCVSIPSNIAEGRYRSSRKDFLQFLRIAYASGAELETQLEIAQNVLKIPPERFKTSKKLLDEIMRMLNVIIQKLNY
ncbi:MAG: four helix bundle protein [Patescibacteria group bacterium]